MCTDKTGTLTEGTLTLTHIHPVESISEDGLLKTALYASPSHDDPLDQAILNVTRQRGIELQSPTQVFPFTEDRKRSTALVQQSDGTFQAFTKGAPEVILVQTDLNDHDRLIWTQVTQDWSREGHKVIACATHPMPSSTIIPTSEPEKNWTLSGLLAFEDPIREDVPASIEACKKMGVRILMLTGDHPDTAKAIARECGIPESNVIARCTPMEKLKVVQELRARGEIVGVTGDGVNDAPALQAADVGFAMGSRGTQSAKEVASIILGDDHFETITHAIQEGRQLTQNLKLSFAYLLLFHFPFIFSAALVPLFDHPIVYLPIQIILLELVIHPTALFAFQNAAQIHPPRQSAKTVFFFDRREAIRMTLSSVLLTLWISKPWFENSEGVVLDVHAARTHALFSLFVWSAALVLRLIKAKERTSQFTIFATLTAAVTFIQATPATDFLQLKAIPIQDSITNVLVVYALSWLVK